jgi:hypothetical protein
LRDVFVLSSVWVHFEHATAQGKLGRLLGLTTSYHTVTLDIRAGKNL